MPEDLARAHIEARLREARQARRGQHLGRAIRLARRAERDRATAERLLSRV